VNSAKIAPEKNATIQEGVSLYLAPIKAIIIVLTNYCAWFHFIFQCSDAALLLCSIN